MWFRRIQILIDRDNGCGLAKIVHVSGCQRIDCDDARCECYRIGKDGNGIVRKTSRRAGKCPDKRSRRCAAESLQLDRWSIAVKYLVRYDHRKTWSGRVLNDGKRCSRFTKTGVVAHNSGINSGGIDRVSGLKTCAGAGRSARV